jgi:hypothetical protein
MTFISLSGLLKANKYLFVAYLFFSLIYFLLLFPHEQNRDLEHAIYMGHLIIITAIYISLAIYFNLVYFLTLFFVNITTSLE